MNVRNKGVLTALLRACRTGNRAEISALLQVVADPIIVDGNGATLLHFAVVWDCSNEVLQAMVESGVAVNVRNRNGITALMKACRRGNIDAMSVLLHAGADPNIVDGNGNTLFRYAVDGDCSKKVLQAIVESDVVVNNRNKNGKTALIKASKRGNRDAICVLLHTGADPNIVDGNGNTLLHYTVHGHCRREVVQATVESGVDVNAQIRVE